MGHCWRDNGTQSMTGLHCSRRGDRVNSPGPALALITGPGPQGRQRAETWATRGHFHYLSPTRGPGSQMKRLNIISPHT